LPKLLEEVYRLQREMTGLDADEQRLLKMFANLLESHYEVKEPQNRLTFEEYDKMPGRWELWDGMLHTTERITRLSQPSKCNQISELSASGKELRI
jgi:hypothetical protein